MILSQFTDTDRIFSKEVLLFVLTYEYGSEPISTPGRWSVVATKRGMWQKFICIPEVFNDECRAEGDAYPYAYTVLEAIRSTGQAQMWFARTSTKCELRQKQLSVGCPGTRTRSSMKTTR